MKEENKNNKNNSDKLLTGNSREEDKKKDIQNIQEEIEKDLRENPKYNSFFEKYHPNSKDIFIDSYKWKKSDWLKYEDIYLNSEEEAVFKYKLLAEECLWQIQQKKLFNFQCEWRAENKETEEIQFTGDFMKWERNIRNCPFLEPISKDEAELYKEYILSDDFERIYFESDIEWQNYNQLKRNFQSEDNYDEFSDSHYPEWYQYYDNRYGTSHLLNLPDIRGEKEMYYITKYKENKKAEFENEKKRKIENGTYEEQVFDIRSYAGAYGEALEEFVMNYENDKIQRLYRADLAMPMEIEDDEELFRSLTALMEAKEKIDMVYGDDWRSSIINTARQFENMKIYECFDSVYAEYLQRLNMGISYEHSEDNSIDRKYDQSKKIILSGRKINGEPEDFNF